MTYKKIGSAFNFDVVRDSDGDIGLVWPVDEDSAVFYYLTIAGCRTLEDSLAELRAACVSPLDRVIEAARKYVASGGTDGFDELTAAVEAFEEADADGDDSE